MDRGDRLANANTGNADANQAKVHVSLGMALAMQGRIADAVTQLELAVVLDPDHADAHTNLGLALAAQGRTADARTHFERVVILKPDNADAHNYLALALAVEGRIAEAIAEYEQALVLKPDYATAHANLGAALAGQGRAAHGLAHLERAVALQPDHAGFRNDLGIALAAQSRIADAVAHYERALILEPDHASAHGNLGNALVEQGRITDGISHLERAVVLKPADADTRNNLGAGLMAQGRISDAIAQYQQALVLQPDHANAHANLGTALADRGRMADALIHLQRALALNPGHADAHNSLGNISKYEGKFEEALTHYGKAIATRPDYGQAYLNRSEIKSFYRGDADLAAMEALAGRDDLSATQAVTIHFALAKALEDTGDYDRAFEHMRQGNAGKRAQIEYHESDALNFFQRVAAVFESSLVDRVQGCGDPSAVPIFVLGMPRSGSTLIEQILASHPQIHAAGELTDFDAAVTSECKIDDLTAPLVQYPECVLSLDGNAFQRIGQAYLARLPALAEGKIRMVDKLPGNYLNIGLIRLALPNAKIVHTMRNPIDTCVSCYSKLFTLGHNYTYDLAELGRFYRGYSELMTHWRGVLPPSAMLDVSYEDVVDDLEGQARRLVDYCGLPWDDRCINFHKGGRPVKTASAVQVRQPLFRSSLQRWRKYEAGLAPLLHELGPLLER